MDTWACADCEYENEQSLDECEACGSAKPAAAAVSDDDPFANIVVGSIEELEQIEGKDKLKKLKVNIGKGSITVVTNAPNVVQGSRIAVACVGAVVRSGSEEIKVKKTSVGGVASEGIVCDAPMLGWTGGGAGTAALLPETFELGSKPPQARPRMK